MSKINIALSFNPTQHMATTEFKRRKVDYSFEEISKVLCMDGRYSSFIFNNDYRLSDNYQPNVSNCIILDFDDGFTREDFKKRANFGFATGTTKSHMIEKNGIVCERFRVVIPTATALSLDGNGVYELMQEIFITYPEADTACKDVARAYSGYVGSEVEIIHGNLFEWGEYHEKALKRRELRKWQKQEKEKPQVKHDGTKADWYREHWLSDVMRAALSVDDKFVSGNRNNAIYTIARYLKDTDLTDGEIIEAIEWVNNGELGDFEIKQVLKGLRVSI